MTDQPVTLTPAVLTDEERASAIENASHVSVELIGELVPYEPELPTAEESTRLNFDIVERYVRAVEIYRDQPIDHLTPAGLEAAKAIRFRLIKLRTRSNELRLEGNRPYMDRIESNNTRYKKIEDLLLPIETRYDKAIKEGERLARERKAEAERKAAEAAQAISDAIAKINGRSIVKAGATAAEIAAAALDLTSDTLDAEFFGNRYGEAVVAKEQALYRLGEAQAAAEASEARDKMLKDQADEIARRDAAEKVRQAVEAARQVQEAKHEEIRRTIANIRGLTAWAIKATAADIRAKQQQLDDFIQGEFHPFEREALAAHAEVTESLPSLLAVAEERERTQAERLKRQQFEAEVEGRFRTMRGLVGLCESLGSSDEVIDEAVAALSVEHITPELFGDRREEALRVGLEQVAALGELRTRAHAERAQAEAERAKAEADRIERERIAADQAAADAKRNRFARALAEQAVAMHNALTMVEADDKYTYLDYRTRAAVDATLEAIANAQKGGTA